MNGKLLFMFTHIAVMFVLSVEMSEGKSPPIAKQGHLSFDQWNFQQNGLTNLDGEWEFYWEQLLEPGDFAGGERPPFLIIWMFPTPGISHP
ncbi:hypothetical protein HUG20_18105 [Salicibibacter cibi]|uniref:Uncharacterized protein n=1 Tax=Salicibibacter cibi TaxID=2743001 RepID=A0A7T6ZE61_9BACI|nr:hypothetical protein [Salicibibacter cibi]QQK81640.1 hypothetical protein HUG20_18105 [Salicibibacter cibi]